MANLPLKYVQQFVDRHGHPRFYFRRPGFKRVALPGMPGSSEFMAAYAEALAAGEPAPPVGLRQIRPVTIDALAVSYFNSADFRELAPSSQSAYRGIIDRLCKQDGEKPVAGLQRRHIVIMRDRRSDQPEAANSLLTMLRVLLKHAVDTGLRKDNPARDVPRVRSKSDGFHSWTDEEIERFEATHPRIASRVYLRPYKGLAQGWVEQKEAIASAEQMALARQAVKDAKWANRIALWALVIAAISLIVAVIK